MENSSTQITDNFEPTIMFFQIFNVVLVIVIIVVAFITIKKVWRFLDRAIVYLDNKNGTNIKE